MVKLAGTFSRLKKINALVVGDFMLDKYTYGEVKRISPEAPVSVLKVENEEIKAGGAGNVVLNLLSLGAGVKVVGRVGNDTKGEALAYSLKQEGADVNYLVVQQDYKTPVKNRFIASSQQILRVDFEDIIPLSEELEKNIIKDLEIIIKDIDVVAISDYGKKFLSDKFIQEIIRIANEKKIIVIIDPKGQDFKKYKGATIIKPNLQEAYLAAKQSSSCPLETVAKIIFDETSIDNLIITRSEEGISIFNKNLKRSDFPVVAKAVKDVTGAGDTVLAMISFALANKLSIKIAAELANIAASIAVEYIGCARITLSDFARRLLEYDSENKIFDESHLYALKEILKGKSFSLLGIDTTLGMTSEVFRTIRKLSLNNQKDLIIYLTDPNPDDEFITLLSSLTEVSFIILHNKNLIKLCEELYPDEIFVMQNDKPVRLDHTQELLESYIN